jgi:hypothetical protein
MTAVMLTQARTAWPLSGKRAGWPAVRTALFESYNCHSLFVFRIRLS